MDGPSLSSNGPLIESQGSKQNVGQRGKGEMSESGVGGCIAIVLHTDEIYIYTCPAVYAFLDEKKKKTKGQNKSTRMVYNGPIDSDRYIHVVVRRLVSFLEYCFCPKRRSELSQALVAVRCVIHQGRTTRVLLLISIGPLLLPLLPGVSSGFLIVSLSAIFIIVRLYNRARLSIYTYKPVLLRYLITRWNVEHGTSLFWGDGDAAAHVRLSVVVARLEPSRSSVSNPPQNKKKKILRNRKVHPELVSLAMLSSFKFNRHIYA